MTEEMNMTKTEVAEFIERMEEIGDVWEEDDVERVYGDRSLQEALNNRMGDEEDSWALDDPNMPDWLHKYL